MKSVRTTKESYAVLILGGIMGLGVGYLLWGGYGAKQDFGARAERREDSAISPGEGPEVRREGKGTGRLVAKSETDSKVMPLVSEEVELFRNILTSRKSIASRAKFYDLLLALTPETAPELADLFVELSAKGVDINAEHELFWQRWGEIDGPSACASIFASNRRFDETPLSNATIAAWAEKDPVAARDWLLSQEDIPLRDGMQNGLLEGMARANIALVEEFIKTADFTEPQKAHGYWRIARHHLEEGGAEAVGRWYQSFDANDPMIRSIGRTTADIYTDGSVGDSLQWVQGLDKGSDEAARLDQYVRSRLVSMKPDLVVNYLGENAGSSFLPKASEFATKATNAWVRINPNGMGEWLRDNMSMPNYDLVAAPFVRNIASSDIEAARKWADTIVDPELRSALKAEIGP